MTDPNLSNLLKWSIANSTPPSTSTATDQSSSSAAASATIESSTPQNQASRQLDPALLASLFGGPSDADLMRSAMEAIQSPTTPLSERLIAFDNFEQLIESLDNANNLSPLGLWTPLISLLDDAEEEIRLMAAWCVGTAVQNNAGSQERALVGGAVPKLLGMIRDEREEKMRRKARYALSSLVRNYQAGMDALVEALADGRGKIDAGDMEAVDRLFEELLKR